MLPNGQGKSCFLTSAQAGDLPPLFLFPTVKMPFCVGIPCQPSAHTAFWRLSRTALGGGRSFHPSSWGFLTCDPGIQSWGGPGAEMGGKREIHLYFH